MSIAIPDVFVSDFELRFPTSFFVCHEMSYLKVSQYLQMVGVQVTGNLFY